MRCISKEKIIKNDKKQSKRKKLCNQMQVINVISVGFR